MASKSLKTMAKPAIALVAVAALLATSIGVAGAAGSDPHALKGSGGVGSGPDDTAKFVEVDIRPHLHTTVVVHVTAGSNDFGASDENLATRAYLGRLTDIGPYLNGRVPFVVDRLITINEDSSSNEQNLGDEKFGFGRNYRTKDQKLYGDIAVGLHEAGRACDQNSKSYCDIVLVAYAAPVADEQRHAMAEAMKLAAAGHSLYTVAVSDSGPSEGKPLASLVQQAENNAAFLSLLSANSYHIGATASDAEKAVEQLFRLRFSVQADDPIEEVPPPTTMPEREHGHQRQDVYRPGPTG